MSIDELPRYRCHKEVSAFKILEIKRGHGATLIGGAGTWRVSVSDEWLHKHDPQPGGYYVLYDDHYESFSPAKVFEEGYTRI